MKRIVSGVQPTSGLTLGNYLGSIKQFTALQDECELFIFIADLHALTTNKLSKSELNDNIKNLIKSYLACGIDPKKTNIFIQSSILEHPALGYILMCNTTLGELNRMTQFKDKTAKLAKEENGTQKLPTGLLIYPTLMAADILLYSPDIVPVGLDQKQHLELTRDIAIRLNNKFKKEVFKIPEPFFNVTSTKIMDLQDPTVKMSKSSTNHKGVIFLNDDIELSIKKIMTAKTDNLNQFTGDAKLQPEVTNLLNIYCSLKNLDLKTVCDKYKGMSYKDFKSDLAKILEEFLITYQKQFNSYHDNEIYDAIKMGTKNAKVIAKQKLNEIYNEIGLENYE